MIGVPPAPQALFVRAALLCTSVAKYAEAIWPGVWEPQDLSLPEIKAVMAVADAERLDLQAALDLANTEAAAAEAVIARVEALIQAEEQRVLEANERFKDRGVIEPKSGAALRLAGIVPTRDLRAALDGDA